MATQYLKPYSCILTNLPVEYDNTGKPIGSSYKSLKGLLAGFGFIVDWVEPGWTKNGFQGYVVIQFGTTPEAFKSANRLEKMFRDKGQGRESWFSDSDKGRKPYLWVARREDHHFFFKVQKKAMGGIFMNPVSVPTDWFDAEGTSAETRIVEAMNNTFTFAP